MKLLKQTTSGAIYVWTASLAARSDMVPYEPEPQAGEQNPNENPNSAQPETAQPVGIEDAIKSFRKEAGKRKKQPPGEP